MPGTKRSSSPPSSGTTTHAPVATRMLGIKLRSVRQKAGLTVRALATKINLHHATVSRYESGERLPPLDRVGAYLIACNVSDKDEYASIVRDFEAARASGGATWVSVGMPEQAQQLDALAEFEAQASRITSNSPLLVPGLLQHEQYATAIMLADSMPRPEIAKRVKKRLARQAVLTGEHPVRLTALIASNVLGQVIGDNEIMATQMQHLAKMATLPFVDIRLVPTDRNWHPGLEGAFHFLEFGGGGTSEIDDPDDSRPGPIVHLEQRTSSLFLHEADDVAAYERAVTQVLQIAMGADESAALIADAESKYRRMGG